MNYPRSRLVLRRPIESALAARVAVGDQPVQAGGSVLCAGEEGVLDGVEDQVGGHRPGGPPPEDPTAVGVDDERDVDEPELPQVLFLLGCEGRGWLARGL